MSCPKRYGLLLPHFGEHATGNTIVKAARQAEAYGFDSVWVRDHLVYPPHLMESQNRTFYEPLVTLAAVGAVTERVVVGTAALIPHRHPISLAQQLATLSQLVGPDRLVIGFGIGNERHEFEVVGLGDAVRPDLHREQMEVVRRIWSGSPIDHHGTYYDFSSVSVLPTPASAVPFWYCGNSAAAARRAAEYCDGWLAGRVTLPTIRARVGRLQRLAGEHGRGPLPAAVVAITSPARTREEALSKANVPGLLRQSNASATEVRPPSGQFETVDDLAGLLLAGPPDAIVEQVRAIQIAGCDGVIFDLRMRFGEWDDALGILATEILPQLRRGDA